MSDLIGAANVSEKRTRFIRELIETIALTLLIFLVIRFVAQSFRVDGESMEPGFHTDEFVLVDKASYLFQSPQRGDVIVFHWPVDTTKDLIKRVIGVPGDVIVVDSTTVQVDGVVLKEPYISAPANPSGSRLVVPLDSYFVLGDNRQVSDDSRDWGFVPKSYIIGKAVLVYWPVSSWQLINTYPSVFSMIKVSHH